MSLSRSRIGCGLFKSVSGGITGIMGAGLVNFAAKYLGYSTFGVLEAAQILALGNFLYGCVVSDANGNDLVEKAAGMDNLFVRARLTRMHAVMFHADMGNIQAGIEAARGNTIREQFFIKDFLFSTFENVTAGTIGFGVLMLLNPSSISYSQLVGSAVTGTIVASSLRSLNY